MHDYSLPPTAVPKELREATRTEIEDFFPESNLSPEVSGGLIVVREYLRTPRGDEILEALRVGAITEMSFAYDPIKFDFEELKPTNEATAEFPRLIRNLRELRLWETSDVIWGMNSQTIAAKTAVPYKDTGTADEGATWSGPSLSDFTDAVWDELSDAERRRIGNHYAFSENWPPEKFSDLKLPHHLAQKTGVGPCVWRGTAAAMGALLGARGGVDIPGGDRRAVYDHLAKHYSQFDKEPPDFKLLELAFLLETFDVKEGRVLSARNLERLKEALAVLSEILLAAEPQDEEEDEKLRREALTAEVFQRMEIAKRNLISLTM